MKILKRVAVMMAFIFGTLTLAAILLPQFFGTCHGSARIEATRSSIRTLEQSLEIFKKDTGRFPTNEEGLDILAKGKGIPGSQGPYTSGNGIFHDAWGTPFRYASCKKNAHIVSAGPDKEFGTEDDITN